MQCMQSGATITMIVFIEYIAIIAKNATDTMIVFIATFAIIAFIACINLQHHIIHNSIIISKWCSRMNGSTILFIIRYLYQSGALEMNGSTSDSLCAVFAQESLGLSLERTVTSAWLLEHNTDR